MCANVNVMKEKNPCEMSACSLLVSGMEQSVRSSRVQSRRAPAEVYYYGKSVESTGGECFWKSSSSVHGLFRNVNSSCFQEALLLQTRN